MASELLKPDNYALAKLYEKIILRLEQNIQTLSAIKKAERFGALLFRYRGVTFSACGPF